MSEPLSLLHIVNDLDTGGAQTLIEALARRRDAPTSVLVLKGPGALSRRVENVVDEVIYVGMSKKRPRAIRARQILLSTVKRLNIDIVHSHLVQSDLLSLFTPHGAFRVSTVHTSGGHESGSLSRLLGHFLARVRHRFDAVVACSPSAMEYIRTATETAELIFNGTSIPDDVIINRPSTVVSLSRWHPMKDHATLIEAFAIFRSGKADPFTLVCAGNGVSWGNDALSSIVERAGVAPIVELRGAVEDIDDLFADAAVSVISSSAGEALPMAGIESLARGIPVLTTDVGDCRELVVDNRLLVPRSDPHAMAEAMRWYLRLPDSDRAILRVAARELALSKFNANETASRYESVYRRLLESRVPIGRTRRAE